ncbi:hypothetical protein DQW50_10070 [Halorubrum sp. 48-1-W]|uniref:hypothetical protein n=1 Tax=Halorubrum sp. 48-1-W TaxID=2249761 RepID=UPI000DCBCE99|nr:hypothetical protein [Halorubrum sp. 48-1-W]RAW45302.1 hypothetical protein DQW50_10070 [Halorubrum sp. 48-1-W]
MEVNSPLEIILSIASFGVIAGAIIYVSPFTVQQAMDQVVLPLIDRALHHPLIALAIGLSVVFLFLFGGEGGAGGEI